MIELSDEIGKEHVVAMNALMEAELAGWKGYNNTIQCLAFEDSGRYDIPVKHPGGDAAKNPHPHGHPLQGFWNEPWVAMSWDVASQLESLGFVTLGSPSQQRDDVFGRWRMEVRLLRITHRGKEFHSRCILKWVLSRATARVNKWLVGIGSVMALGTGFGGAAVTIYQLGVWVLSLFA